MTVTTYDLYRAGQALARAEAKLNEMRPRRWMSKASHDEYTAAKAAVIAAEERLEQLQAQHNAQQQYVGERPDRETASRLRLDAMAKDLEASRKQVVKAVTAAQRALLEVTEAAGSHNALVASAADELAAMGLDMGSDWGDVTGGGEKLGTGPAVRIRGTDSLPVRIADLLGWIKLRVTEARLTGRSNGFEPLWSLPDETAGLLEGVPDVPAVDLEQPEPVRRGELAGAPTFISRSQAAQIRSDLEKELHGWSTPRVLPEGQIVWVKTTPSDAVKRSVKRRQEQLEVTVAETERLTAQADERRRKALMP